MKNPSKYLSLALVLICLMLTVACGSKIAGDKKTTAPPKKEETTQAVTEATETSGTTSDAEQTAETEKITDTSENNEPESAQKNDTDTEKQPPKKLIDDVPKDTYDVLEGVETPYQFFRKVTAEDVDSVGGSMFFDGLQFGLDIHTEESAENGISEFVKILKSINGSEITEYSAPKTIEWGKCDAYLDLNCDDNSVSFLYYNEGYVELAFTADTDKTAKNPDLYGYVRWRIDNAQLNSFFEMKQNELGGLEGPGELIITEEPFTIAGDDIGKYYIRSELDKLIVKVSVPKGVEFAAWIGWEASGGGPSSQCIDSYSTKNESVFIFRCTPMFSDTIMRFDPALVAGCTVTIRGEKGYT